MRPPAVFEHSARSKAWGLGNCAIVMTLEDLLEDQAEVQAIIDDMRGRLEKEVKSDEYA